MWKINKNELTTFRLNPFICYGNEKIIALQYRNEKRNVPRALLHVVHFAGDTFVSSFCKLLQTHKWVTDTRPPVHEKKWNGNYNGCERRVLSYCYKWMFNERLDGWEDGCCARVECNFWISAMTLFGSMYDRYQIWHNQPLNADIRECNASYIRHERMT